MSSPALPDEREPKREPSFILRSNRVSGLLTVLGLAATVVTIYLLFPRRNNELMTQAAVHHRDPGEYDLQSPSAEQLGAWSAGVLEHRDVPLPVPGGRLTVTGARSVSIMKRRTALVRYRVGDDEVTLVVQRTRDALPRKHRRRDGDEMVVSWRKGKFTMVAVGRAETAEHWMPLIGAP